LRNASISVGIRIAVAAHSPAKVAEPSGALRIDGNSKTSAQDTTACKRRGWRSVRAIRWSAIGFEHYDGMAGVWRTLTDIVGDPSVASRVESEITWATKQKVNVVATGIVYFDGDRPRIWHSHEGGRIQVAEMRQDKDLLDVLPRIAGEVCQGLCGIAQHPATWWFG